MAELRNNQAAEFTGMDFRHKTQIIRTFFHLIEPEKIKRLKKNLQKQKNTFRQKPVAPIPEAIRATGPDLTPFVKGVHQIYPYRLSFTKNQYDTSNLRT